MALFVLSRKSLAISRSAMVGRPQSAKQKLVRARGPQNRNPELFNQTSCSRTSECIEFALNDRELVKTEEFELTKLAASFYESIAIANVNDTVFPVLPFLVFWKCLLFPLPEFLVF